MSEEMEAAAFWLTARWGRRNTLKRLYRNRQVGATAECCGQSHI